ncbi:MAG: hypothetical protein K6G38_01525 [Gammaproteobacteria bacterium]|nr:hypothetical protein [Gammaproteobacteria bacterium]
MKQIKANYIDLSELILKHHKLHNELSLFKALLIYKGINARQVHDALVDAQATKEVYDEFKKDINGELDLDLKEEVNKLSKHEQK